MSETASQSANRPASQPAILFGIDVPTLIEDTPDPAASARRAERLGFDFVSANDHLLGAGPRYEGWTLLAWLASATTRMRLVTRVLGVPYRHPVLVAKMAETLDRLTGGRLILGLGAGSGADEYAAMGLETGGAPERAQALEEAVAILRGLWSATPFTDSGERYQVVEAEMLPKPAHDIPTWIGTVGRRGLELIGRSADGWIPSLPDASPDHATAMMAKIDAAAGAAGRDPDRIARTYNLFVSFAEEPGDKLVSGFTGRDRGAPDRIRSARLHGLQLPRRRSGPGRAGPAPGRGGDSRSPCGRLARIGSRWHATNPSRRAGGALSPTRSASRYRLRDLAWSMASRLGRPASR